jgi:hypothetical protein
MEITTVEVLRDMSKNEFYFWNKLKIKLECLAEMNEWPEPYYARMLSVAKTDKEGILLATFSIHDGLGDEDDYRRQI